MCDGKTTKGQQKIPKQQPTLSPAALEARRAYQRSYRKSNPGRVKEWERRRWERVAARAESAHAEMEVAED